MNKDFKYVWKHQSHGLLGVHYSIDELIKDMNKNPYPRPDKNKMIEQLAQKSEYSYSLGLLIVKRVPGTVNPENIF